MNINIIIINKEKKERETERTRERKFIYFLIITFLIAVESHVICAILRYIK